MEEKKITAKRKPKKCPKCRCAKVASILYGLRISIPKLERDLNEGKVVLGGCCISDCDPAWQCIECGAQIYRKRAFPPICQKNKAHDNQRINRSS